MATGLSDHNLTLFVRKLTKQLFNSPNNKNPHRMGIPSCKTGEFENSIKKINWSEWLKDEVWKLMKEKDSALKAAIKSKLRADRQICAMLRNKVTKEMRKAKAKYFIDVINEAKDNTIAIWKRLKILTREA